MRPSKLLSLALSLSLALLAMSVCSVRAQQPKTVSILLRAKWNATSLLAEAGEFFAAAAPHHFWKLLDATTRSHLSDSDSDSDSDAEHTSVPLSSSSASDLKRQLTLSASSPSDRQVHEFVLQQAVLLLGPSSAAALRYSLASHFYSPRVEMYRQMHSNHLSMLFI